MNQLTREEGVSLRAGVDLKEALASHNMYVILTKLEPYAKFMSIACLLYARLPALPTFLFIDWNDLVEQRVREFSFRLSLDQVMLRSQAKSSLFGQSYGAIPVAQVSRVAQELFSDGSKIVALHPELSIHRDKYSVHIDFDFLSTLRVMLEVVGPGFTATHLSRGGIVHERIRLSAFGSAYGLVGAKRVWRIPDEAYQRDVCKIIGKYGRDALVDKQSLLLEHRHSYPPIPTSFIRYIHNSLGDLRKAISYMSLDSARTAVSMSFFRPVGSPVSKPVFWDIHELH